MRRENSIRLAVSLLLSMIMCWSLSLSCVYMSLTSLSLSSFGLLLILLPYIRRARNDPNFYQCFGLFDYMHSMILAPIEQRLSPIVPGPLEGFLEVVCFSISLSISDLLSLSLAHSLSLSLSFFHAVTLPLIPYTGNRKEVSVWQALVSYSLRLVRRSVLRNLLKARGM